jgi:small subunit ribosomal protein S21
LTQKYDYTIIFLAGPRGEEKTTQSGIHLGAKIDHERGEFWLSEVKISENESFETALKRFNRKTQQDGILAEARRREYFEKPSMKRKRKEAARRRKAVRRA